MIDGRAHTYCTVLSENQSVEFAHLTNAYSTQHSRRLSDMSVQGASFLHLAMVMELMHLLSFNIHDSTLFDVRLDYT